MPYIPRSQNRYFYFRHKVRQSCPSCLRRIPSRRAYAWTVFDNHRQDWIDLVIFCEHCYTRMCLHEIRKESQGGLYNVSFVSATGYPLPSWLQYTPVQKV